MQILELADKDLRITVINVLEYPQKQMNIMANKMRNYRRDMKSVSGAKLEF